MLRRHFVRSVISTARRGFSETKNTQTGQPPAYNPIEFEPFKFKHERENLIYGYTLQELYGKRYGHKQSPAVRREMSKDNIMMFIAIVGSLTLAIKSRDLWYEDAEVCENYLYHDMNYYRHREQPCSEYN